MKERALLIGERAHAEVNPGLFHARPVADRIVAYSSAEVAGSGHAESST